MDKVLGIIIPVYNEGESIEVTIHSIKDKIKTSHKIYIIYDFDEDNTLPVVNKIINSGIPIELIKNPVKGVVNAIKTGLSKAEEEYLLVTMADMSDDYGVVDLMCKLMSEGYDVVCGSRYMRGGKQIGGPLIKKLLSGLAGISLKYLAGIPTHDATNSFKLYRKSMINAMEIESDGGFEIGLEIVTKAYSAGYRITEIPCVWTDRDHGESRFRIIKWAPKYLKWYVYAIKNRLRAREKIS